MKHYFLIPAMMLALTACGNSGEETLNDSDVEVQLSATDVDQPSAIPAELNADNKVLLMVDRLVPEPAACLVMISVINGTDETVNAGLFAFNVTGNGETAGANMFPQTVDAGDVKTAQIVLPGADCDNANRIEGGQLNCRFPDSDESCLDVVELRDGVVDFTGND